MSAEEHGLATARRVGRNYAFLSASQVAVTGLSMLAVVGVARHFGAAEYGKLAFAIAFASYFGLVPDSLVALGVRELARRRDETPRFVGSVAVLRVAIAVACLAAMAPPALALVPAWDTRLLLLVLGLNSVVASTDLGWAFNAHESMAYPSLAKSVGQAVYAAGALVLVAAGAPLVTVAIALAVGSGATALLSLAFFRRHLGRPVVAIRPSEYRSLLVGALPVSLSYAMVQAYVATGVVLLSLQGDGESVGWYAAANRLVAGLLPFSYMYFNAIHPLLSRRFQESPTRAGRLVEQSVKLMLAVGLPTAVGGTVLAPQVIGLLYGEAYAPAARALQVLSWAVAAVFLSQALSSTLLSLDRQGAFARNVTVGAVANLATNLALIPRLGFVGVAVATLVTEFVVVALGGREVARAVPFSFWRHVPRPAMAAGLMGLALWPLAGHSLLLTIPLGALVYCAALYLLGGLAPADLERLGAVVRRGKETTA